MLIVVRVYYTEIACICTFTLCTCIVCATIVYIGNQKKMKLTVDDAASKPEEHAGERVRC